jgi:serine/threonine-protein kinase ULK/ATG1
VDTPLYAAPEILNCAEFSSKCDVWSIGVIFYEMLYGCTPWTGKDIIYLKNNILNKPLQIEDSVCRP